MRSLLSISSAALLIEMLLVCAAQAQDQPHERPEKPPEYQKLRYDEDSSYLKDPAKRTDFLDPIKYIPLNAAGDTYLSLGGEARWRYELYHNNRWNSDSPDKDGYFLQRYLLHADLHVSD